MAKPGSIRSLAAHTQAVYERNAALYDARRAKVLFEKTWLDRFLSALRPGGTILDIGCGTGDPIAAYLRSGGFRIIGVDASRAMLDIARTRFPEGDWRHADMRALDLGESFDGIIAWDSFFHLTPEEQRATISRFAAHLAPGGALMLTVGPEAGEVAGHVGADPVYHSSLSREDYAQCLARDGLDIVSFAPEDPDCDFHTILLALKTPAEPAAHTS
jgi:SAM-dependent methyltransferase